MKSNNNELDKWTRKERSHRSFNDSNDLNNGLKSEIDSFKSEVNSYDFFFRKITIKYFRSQTSSSKSRRK